MERAMRIPTAPKHRPTGGGSFDCASFFPFTVYDDRAWSHEFDVVVLSLRFILLNVNL